MFVGPWISVGAEMFEQDNQAALNLYLNGKMTEKGLDSAARLWKNYKTDYAPLVNLAKENKLNFFFFYFSKIMNKNF